MGYPKNQSGTYGQKAEPGEGEMIIKDIRETLSLRSPLGRSISVFLLLLLFIVAGSNIWSLYSNWNKRVSEIADEAMNLSVSQARQAEDTFLQVEFTLRDILREVREQGMPDIRSPSMHRFLQIHQERLSQLHGLFIYNAEGHWIATAGEKVPENPNNADREYFQWHRMNPGTAMHIGKVLRSRSTGDLIIPVSLRMDDSAGNFAGVVLATVRVDYFRQFYNYFELGSRDMLALTLADSTVLYARPYSNAFINKSIISSPVFSSRSADAQSGSNIWHSRLDGIERIHGYARLKRFPLVVISGYDKAAIQAQWLKGQLPGVIGNGVLLVVILFMGAMVLRQAGAHIRNQNELTRTRDRLTSINQTLQSLALIDGLTGLANRRQFNVFLNDSLKRSARTGKPVSLILMEIDRFRHFEKRQGPEAAQSLLQATGTVLREMPLMGTDMPARFDEEKFAIIMPDTLPEIALQVGSQLLQALRQRKFNDLALARPERVISFSAGCGSLSGTGSADDASRLLQQASEALSEAIQKGGNQVAQYQRR